jgi:CheY-like chemotaxis protein
MTPSPELSGHVLVIDDEPSLCRLLLRCLRGRHHVSAVADGTEAIELLRKNPHFDVILCDVMMPVGGDVVYRSVIAVHPQLAGRFVFLSGATFAPEARMFLDSLPNLRIDKPFDINELITLVQQLVDERQDLSLPSPSGS